MKGSAILNMFKDISLAPSQPQRQGNTAIDANELFHKLLAKEIHETNMPEEGQAGGKSRWDSSRKEEKLVASLAGLAGFNPVIPSAKANTLFVILKRLGLRKEQISAVLAKATDANGLIHLDKLARDLEAILRGSLAKDSSIAVGREYVPILALAFLRLGADLEAVRGVLEKYASAKSELKLNDVSAMVHGLAPGLQLNEKDTKTLLQALGIPVMPEDMASLLTDGKTSRELRPVIKQIKDGDPDIISKTKLAHILRRKGIAPEKVKEILESVNFEEIRGNLGKDKKEKITNSEIQSLLQSIRLDDKREKKLSSLKQHLAKVHLKGLTKGNGKRVPPSFVQKKTENTLDSNREKSGSSQFIVTRADLKDSVKGDLTFLKRVDKAKQLPASILTHPNSRSTDSVRSATPVNMIWVDPHETLGKVMQHLKLMLMSREQESRITLHPPDLGQMDLRVTAKHGHLQIQLGAEHPWAKEIIEGNLNALRQQLNQAGFVVDKLDVMVGLGGGGFAPHSERDGKQEWSLPSRNMEVSGPALVVQPSPTPGLIIKHNHQLSIVV